MPATPLTENERMLFYQLIEHTRTLVRTCNLASETLSSEFQSMIMGPVGPVETVLAQCPQPPTHLWSGKFQIEDCDEELYTPQDLPEDIRRHRINTGVKLTHRPTHVSMKAHASADRDVNRQRVARALKQKVEREYREQIPDPLR